MQGRFVVRVLTSAVERVAHIHDEQMLRDIHPQLIIFVTEGEAHRFLTGLPDGRK